MVDKYPLRSDIAKTLHEEIENFEKAVDVINESRKELFETLFSEIESAIHKFLPYAEVTLFLMSLTLFEPVSYFRLTCDRTLPRMV